MSFLFINNTSKRLHGVGTPVAPKQSGAQVKPTIVSLKPGINKVDKDQWDEAKKQKMVQVLIDESVLVEVATVDDFKNLEPDSAKKMIDGIVDDKLLVDWAKSDRRKTVQKMLKERLEELSKVEPGTVPPERVTGGGKTGANKDA